MNSFDCTGYLYAHPLKDDDLSEGRQKLIEIRPCVERDIAEIEHHPSTAKLILSSENAEGELSWFDSHGKTSKATINPHQCWLIPAGVRHFVRGLQPGSIVSLLVDSAVFGDYVQSDIPGVMAGNLRQISGCSPLTGHLATEFGRLLAKSPHTLWVQLMALTLALQLVRSLLGRSRNITTPVQEFSPTEQKRVSDFVRTHLQEGIKVSALARKLGLSRAHFTRRFHATFGMPPLRYLLKIRVDQALELLRSGDYRVSEAALAVGFCDQSHLDRHCRKFYGRAPSVMLRD